MIGDIAREILKGKTIIRALMNSELKNYALSGYVLDIGGGEKPSYLRFFKSAPDLKFIGIDLNSSDSSARLDLETQPLPQPAGSMDTILLFNILEHIYNHNFLIGEARRVIKPTGEVIGFVPFLVGYHPDPRDYFRYTKEALERIFRDAGFSQIEIRPVGGGPVLANLNLIMIYFPKILNFLLWPAACLLDKIFLLIKPGLWEKFPLGYLFKCQP